MNHTRILRFEVMEPRIALTANASALSPDMQGDASANGLDTAQAQGMLEQIGQSRAETSAIQSITPPMNELGDTPVVRFRVEIRDLQDQLVEAVQAGGEYLAKIFVQDMRDLTSDNPADIGNGGLYQAWVDLEFSENLQPTGSVRVNEAFSCRTLDAEIDGSSLRNLGGVASNVTPFGGAEQFFLEAPFVVGSTDAPVHIQVVPATWERDPVLLFGSSEAVPTPNITSPAFDLPSATNVNSGDRTAPPLLDPPADSSAELPASTPPANALPNSGDGSHEATSDDNSVALVSYTPFFRDDDPNAHWQRRDKDDWWRSKRGEDERNHTDDWNEIDWPDEGGKTLDAKSVNRDDSSPVDDTDSDEEGAEEDRDRRQSKHAGLFYDEALFLEGALVETFKSKFRLQLQVFSPQRDADEIESDANNHATPQRDGFIDIAAILTPKQHTRPWQDSVDEAIAGNQESPSPEYRGPAINWGMIGPLPGTADTHPQSKQAEANQKLPDQRIPLAMNQPVTPSSEDGLPPTVR